MSVEPESAGQSSGERLVAGPVRRLLTWRPEADGRAVVVAAIVLYLSIIAALRLGWHFDLWPYLGVPSGPSLFFDARNLTAAWECQRLGNDPLFDNPCDPWRRPLMYLRPWLVFGVLGLDQSHTVALGVVLVAAMFVSFLVLVDRVPLGTGIALAVAACSPAVMLAVERANMDVALFSLVTVSLLLWRATPGPARIASPLLIFLGATAKVYPVFALPAFVVTRDRVAAWVTLLCIAAFGGYLIVNLHDVRHAAQIAIQGDGFSYGARILIAHLYHQVGADRWSGPAALKQLIAALPVAIAAAAIAVRVRRRFVRQDDQATVSTASLVALHVGALIYLGTFLVANNFDYRLVFLLLTLPQLAAWARTPGDQLSSMASITLLGILVLLWVGSLSEWLHLWDELASWGVAGLLAAIVAATFPPIGVIRQTVFGGLAPAPSGR